MTESTQTGRLKIARVQSTAELNAFLRLPYQIYSDNPVWVPPLSSELRNQFDSRRNPFLKHCDYDLFLLREGKQFGLEKVKDLLVYVIDARDGYRIYQREI